MDQTPVNHNRHPEFPQFGFVAALLTSFAIIVPLASANIQRDAPFSLNPPPLTFEDSVYAEAVVHRETSTTAYLQPSTNAEAVLSLEPNTDLVIVGRTDTADWFEIRTRTGLAGWVTADALTLKHNTTPLPVTDAAPLDVRFAVVGDSGYGDFITQLVANMVNDWNVDFMLATGDMNMPDGQAQTIDAKIGQYFHNFIHPYAGEYGSGAPYNRLFPALGNHEYYTPNAQPHIDYFQLPGNERYYDFRRGSVHFFAVDSNSENPDGATEDSVQGTWLHNGLQNSTAPFKIVYFHHSPYSSGVRGSKERMRWDFHEWGATLVMSAHDHNYQRVQRDEGTYIVNGAASTVLAPIETPVAGTVVGVDHEHGAVLVDATATTLRVRFIAVDGETLDDFTLATE